MASIDNCAFDNLCCSSAREVTNEGTIVGTSQRGRRSTTVVNGGIERTFNVSACEFDRKLSNKGLRWRCLSSFVGAQNIKTCAKTYLILFCFCLVSCWSN